MKKKILLSLLTVVGILTTAGLKAQDVCSSNPNHCKVLQDSGGIKMMLITLPPGAKLDTHTHPINIGYVLKGGLYEWTYTDGKTEQAHLKPGEDFVGGAEPAHFSWNGGKSTIQFILIEKQD